MLNRFRNDLSVAAQPQEMDAAANRTIAHLQTETAKVAVQSVDVGNGRLEAAIAVENLGGHKLPTAYPSRRAWLHVTVRDGNGAVVFESGALDPDGSIHGNDNDEDATRFEPHYTADHAPRSGADLRERHGRPGRRRDHRAADGGALCEGQPAAAARIRQTHGRPGRRGPRRRGRRRRLHRRGRSDPVLGCPWRRAGSVPGRRRAVVPADRLPLGDESQDATRRWKRSGSSATTRRWRPLPVWCWRTRPRRSSTAATTRPA